MSGADLKLYAIGAFDRINYGDLLFPHVLKTFISKIYPGVSVEAYSLSRCNFQAYGALPSKPIRSLGKKGFLKENQAICFAGGGIVGSDWFDMFSNTLGRRIGLAGYYAQKIVGRDMANTLSRIYYGANSPFPWIASREDFPLPVKILYNSIGGSEYSSLKPDIQRTILDKLAKADYLSVRDAESKRLFKSIEQETPVYLAPDSAALIADLFPLDQVEGKVDPAIKELAESGEYLCFQSNTKYYLAHEEVISTQLDEICSREGLGLVLLPIGRYADLDDYRVMKRLQQRLKSPARVISDSATLWDTLYIIAKSKLFVGTSLHGNITALAYARPYIGLSIKPGKLDLYLQTWGIGPGDRCVPVGLIANAIGEILSVSSRARERLATDLATLVSDNITRMVNTYLPTCALVEEIKDDEYRCPPKSWPTSSTSAIDCVNKPINLMLKERWSL